MTYIPTLIRVSYIYFLSYSNDLWDSSAKINMPCAYHYRIEKVRLDRRDGIAKVVGTLACVAGATVITLYKGPTIFSPSSRPPPGLSAVTTSASSFSSAAATWLGEAKAGKSWTLGCVYLIGHCLSWSGWLVLQAPVLKKYPARLSVTSYTCFFGVIQFLVIAAFVERNAQAWVFHTGTEVFTILYAVSSSYPLPLLCF